MHGPMYIKFVEFYVKLKESTTESYLRGMERCQSYIKHSHKMISAAISRPGRLRAV